MSEGSEEKTDSDAICVCECENETERLDERNAERRNIVFYQFTFYADTTTKN